MSFSLDLCSFSFFFPVFLIPSWSFIFHHVLSYLASLPFEFLPSLFTTLGFSFSLSSSFVSVGSMFFSSLLVLFSSLNQIKYIMTLVRTRKYLQCMIHWLHHHDILSDPTFPPCIIFVFTNDSTFTAGSWKYRSSLFLFPSLSKVIDTDIIELCSPLPLFLSLSTYLLTTSLLEYVRYKN